MKQYIMAMDQGTTSCRCILFDGRGEPVSSASKEFRQIYPAPGWVEHDPTDIWSTQIGVAQEAMLKARCTHRNIAAIGITNQRETTVLWDRHTGEPVCNAIVWQCRRTADMADELIARGLTEFFRERTGLPVDAYFSATKLRRMLDSVDGARRRAENGDLLFGTIETWLIWKLTRGRVHVTDYSNASRTMLFNIHSLRWDEDILRELDIPASLLPEAVPSSAHYGDSDPDVFGGPIPICGAAGDQQAALFGHACFAEGEAKNTYGTGCFLLMNTGEKPVRPGGGLLTTVAWGLRGRVVYALEGSVFVAGAAIQWLRDELRLIDTAAESERLAASVEDTGGVYMVPAFVGLGAPYWDPHARGAITGLTRGTGRAHLVRAALESIAYSTADLIAAMEKACGARLKALRADGGASANDFLMQFQADIIGARLMRPACTETTALGAAYLAGLAAGYWADEAEIRKLHGASAAFEPRMPEARREDLLAGWRRAVRSVTRRV
ncbi:MAG: glycerol kinase GlpK [Clostridiales Family XIII bacterium]|jgi:glycerol kinase|nr:glycerol kinase GlpK [Clostridiales Family XIII bacterium]